MSNEQAIKAGMCLKRVDGKTCGRKLRRAKRTVSDGHGGSSQVSVWECKKHGTDLYSPTGG